MNRLKFIKIDNTIEFLPPVIYENGLLTVNHLIEEKLMIIIDLKSGICLNYIKINDKQKDIKKLKLALDILGVKIDKEIRKKI